MVMQLLALTLLIMLLTFSVPFCILHERADHARRSGR